MRTFVLGSGLSMVLVATAGAQARDSSYWTVGASFGVVDRSPIAFRSSRSAGSLQAEWRRYGQRLGVRAEIGVVQRDQLLSFDQVRPCASCYHENNESTARGLVSMLYEWRQGRLLRPYAILGAGIERAERLWGANYDYQDGVLVRSSTQNTSTRLGMTTVGGIGVSANVGRFTGFVESRARSGGYSASESFSFGIRIRPD